jgi:hypothetical protein
MKVEGHLNNCPVCGEVVNIITAERFTKDSDGNISKVPYKIYQVATIDGLGITNLEEHQIRKFI